MSRHPSSTTRPRRFPARRYPERLVPSTLSLSKEYMARESSHWERDIEKWVRAYAARNIIPFSEVKKNGEPRLQLNFPSIWRQKFFVLRGNSEFPYFEFL